MIVIFSLTVMQTRVGNQVACRATLPLKILKKNLSFLIPGSDGSTSLACGRHKSVLHMAFLTLCLCVLSLVRTPLIRFKAHPPLQGDITLRSLTAYPKKVLFTGTRGWDLDIPLGEGDTVEPTTDGEIPLV